MRYGLIAGNGRFPLLALENARKLGHEVVAIGILEEASREIELLAARCHWISLGELSRLIDILKAEGITEVMMAGQVKHAKIFSSIRPDWRLLKLLGLLLSNTVYPMLPFTWQTFSICHLKRVPLITFSCALS